MMREEDEFDIYSRECLECYSEDEEIESWEECFMEGYLNAGRGGVSS